MSKPDIERTGGQGGQEALSPRRVLLNMGRDSEGRWSAEVLSPNGRETYSLSGEMSFEAAAAELGVGLPEGGDYERSNQLSRAAGQEVTFGSDI